VQNDSGISMSASRFSSNQSSISESPIIRNIELAIKKDSPVEDKENKETQNGDNKKNRTTFTDHQKRMLDVYFSKNPYPDPKETEDLSQQLVLPENVIKVWFQNKRSRDKQRKFSHANRKLTNCNGSLADNSNLYSSPLVANLQYLTSKINPYSFSAAVAAVAAAAASNQHHQNLYNQY